MPITARLLIFLLLALPLAAARAANETLRTISWPPSLLASPTNLRISEIRITLACGEFKAVRFIPTDWNVEVERPVSARAQLHLSAGHGASDLPNLKALDGAIVISGASARCFDILATVYTETNMHRLTRTDLLLKELR